MCEYGTPIIMRVLPILIAERIEQETQRRIHMEKYGVQVDPKKVEDAKKKAPGEKTAGVDDPNVNVPKDPDEGTRPFETTGPPSKRTGGGGE
jgi:hypothetical protein